MKRNVCLSVMVAMVAMTTAVSACGGDDKSAKAPAQCRAFVKAACDAFIDCGFVANQGDCQDALEDEGIDCDDAVSIGEDYKDCLDDLDDLQCGDEPELPRSCEDAVTIER